MFDTCPRCGYSSFGLEDYENDDATTGVAVYCQRCYGYQEQISHSIDSRLHDNPFGRRIRYKRINAQFKGGVQWQKN